jgi:imidazolonepropionase-like amidohydrolase
LLLSFTFCSDYHTGTTRLGVVEEGAFADLLLVDGDPIANIKLIQDPAKNFVVIVKDGKIFKNTL